MLHHKKHLHPHIENNKVQPSTSQNFRFSLIDAIVSLPRIDKL